MSTFELETKLANDTILIADLPLCRLLLTEDQQYPWFILVPRVANTMEIYELSDEQQAQLLIESNALSKWAMQHFNGDKLNVAALGNVSPQLHIHHIVRFKHDAAWPRPIWGVSARQPYNDSERNNIINAAKAGLSALINV